jgi:hypothetical protein
VARPAPIPYENTYRSRAANKRRAAAKRRVEADRLEAEADDLERRWQAYVAKRDAKPRQRVA